MSITRSEAAARGERLRDAGVSRAAHSHRDQIDRDELRFLDALASSPDGTATVDDAVPDLADRFADGGRWRGDAPKRLARDGLIRRVEIVRSSRPARHRGYISRWAIADRSAVESRRAQLRAAIAAFDLINIKKETGEADTAAAPVTEGQ